MNTDYIFKALIVSDNRGGAQCPAMADSASESDTGSLDGGSFQPPSPVSRDQLHKRIESLQQQNRVLNVELETYKLRVKSLQVRKPVN